MSSIETIKPPGSLAEEKITLVKQLENLQPLTIPYIKPIASSRQQLAEITTSISNELKLSLGRLFPEQNPTDILFAAFVGYLARISNTSCFDLGFADSLVAEETTDLEDLFTAYIPCRFALDLQQNFVSILEVVGMQLERAKQCRSHTINIISRDSVLNALPELDGEQMLPVGIMRVEDLADRQIERAFGRSLTLSIAERDLQWLWQYDPAVLAIEDIHRMWSQFETLLQSLIANSEQSFAELSLLPVAEHHQIFQEWNGDRNVVDLCSQDRCIQQLFEEQVELTPNAIAVEYRGERLTYSELNTRANQLADYLSQLGVGAEVLVGFFVERSLEMLVGLLGILKAGGAYVPLDPAYPSERLAYMVEDAQISVLLTQQELLNRLPKCRAEVVCLDSDWEKVAQCSKSNPTITTTAENLAYIIYTSGSTGKPKGVMISHRALSLFAQTARNEYGIKQSDRALQFASINFDVAVEEIYTTLLAGGTLVLRTDGMLADANTFFQTCRELQLTILNFPTAYWHQLVGEMSNSKITLPESIRLVIIGGEKVLPEPVKFWQKYVTKSGRNSLRLLNTYGPTETTVSATMYEIVGDTEIEGEVPIGRPLPHLQTYILDRHRQPVPIGVPGELYIGGSSLARGYLNRAELTADKFIPNPFTQTPGARLYQTGDLVRYLSDGNIEYIGRIDKQVKIRGFRIELGEIETALARHPQVKATAVIAREDRPGDKKLVAYFVPQQPESDLVGSSQLRSFLQQQLPSYMLPTAYVRLESLPITPGGKVDRRALPAPDFSREDLKQLATPNSDTERKLVEIWQSVLQVSPIGIEDNFFELGGHSLLAVSLLSQIEQTFNRSIPLATFLGVPTIEGLAAAIVESGSATSETSGSLLFPIRETGSKTPLFLVNAMGTGMLAYKLLAKYLDAERPIYGIKALGMDDSRLPHNRIEQMAGAYIEEMLKVQPAGTGAYCLAGVCTGGTVAYEMACQLKERGLSVEFLGLIDSTARPNLTDDGYGDETPIATSKSSPSLWSEFFNRYIKHNFAIRGLNNLFAVAIDPNLRSADKLSFALDMVRQLAKKIEHKLEKFTHRGEGQMSYEARRSRVFAFGVEALWHYTPQPYQDGKIVLIRARDNPEHVEHNYQLGWDEFISQEFEIYEIPADQTTLLFEPHIRTLAAKLNSCLADLSRDRSLE